MAQAPAGHPRHTTSWGGPGGTGDTDWGSGVAVSSQEDRQAWREGGSPRTGLRGIDAASLDGPRLHRPSQPTRGVPALSRQPQCGQTILSSPAMGSGSAGSMATARGLGGGGAGGLPGSELMTVTPPPSLPTGGRRPAHPCRAWRKPAGAWCCEGREGPGDAPSAAPTPGPAGREQRTVTQGPSSRWLAPSLGWLY